MRTTGGWITAPWVHLSLVSALFADFAWDHARRLAAAAGMDDANEADVARVLDELLTRAEHGPDLRSARVIARTGTAAALPGAAVPEAAITPDPDPETDLSTPTPQRPLRPQSWCLPGSLTPTPKPKGGYEDALDQHAAGGVQRADPAGFPVDDQGGLAPLCRARDHPAEAAARH